MNQEEFQLPRRVINELLHSAQQSPTEEVCGLVGAKNAIANTCYPIKNTAASPENRFQLDEKQQINALSTMRDKGESLAAIYHSHPTAAATPSKTDIALAAYPEAVYLIISLNTKGVLEMKGFKIAHNSFTEVALSLIP